MNQREITMNPNICINPYLLWRVRCGWRLVDIEGLCCGTDKAFCER
jgi:hypothetical protein